MMVLKFQDYIKEGLWSKGVNRSKTGDIRNEDKVVLNIEEFKEIDLGFSFVFSDIDLTIGGQDEISWEDYENIKKQITETGWRLPGWHELKKCLFKFAGNPPEMSDDLIVNTKSEMMYTDIFLKSKSTDETLTFDIDNPYGQSYWLEFDGSDLNKIIKNHENARIIRISTPRYAMQNGCLFSFENENKKEKLKIRLIKDK